jgi:alpha-N-arabinofuranosidase
MVISPGKFDLLVKAFERAEEKGVLLYDVMTERHEITTILQKELASTPSLFGQLKKGTPDEPAITKESVHHFFKYVAGNPIKRPAWFFDPAQRGEGLVDVSTHLVDLIQWECFPCQIIDYKKDIQMLSAKRWATVMTLDQFKKVTHLDSVPDYLKKYTSGNKVSAISNGQMIYKIKDIHAKISVVWNYQAPAGTGDTHYSIMRGTNCSIIIQQGKDEGYKPTLYVEALEGKDIAPALAKAVDVDLQKKYPGISTEKLAANKWKVNIPKKYHIGHEAHFAQVTEKYLGYLVDGKLPDWEVPNMIAKYYTTTQALKAVLVAACVLTGCSSEYHVSTTGLDGNPGTTTKPFKTISYAAQIAQPGDVVTVHEGVYRERVNPSRSGTSNKKQITYQAAKGEKVVIKGSEIVKGWKKVQDDTWKVTIPNSFFGDFNPYSDIIGGEWYGTPKDGFDRHTGAVYLNGNWLDEAKDMKNVLAPVGERPLWKAEVDEKNTTIWAQFKDVNPNKELAEINVRQSIFYPDKSGRNYITVRGFTMRQAATPWSGAMSEQIGLIGTHWSKGWIIEDNVISHSMNTGITLGRYDLGKYGIALPAVSAPGFVKSCELALEHGWSKEKIGSHVIRNNHISHCEKNGIHGSLGGIFSTIEGNTICDIAQRGWISGPDVAGLKLLASNDVIIRNNHIYRCSKGLWLDWMTQGTRVTGNLFHDNIGLDLDMEVNHGPFLIDHNLFLSKREPRDRSIRDMSQGGAYVHNLIAGGDIYFWPRGIRTVPYFHGHSAKLKGLQKLQGGDNRYLNNIFVGSIDQTPYDKAKLPVSMAGNVYVNGAKPSMHDRDVLVDADFDPGIKFYEKADGWWLEMAVDPAWTSKQKRDIVTTELLGKAKIPDAPFEKPDGTGYRLDVDYFGNKRNPNNPCPGPFAEPREGKRLIKVWPKE